MPRWLIPYIEGRWATDALPLINDPNYMRHSMCSSTHVDIEYRNPGPTDPRAMDYLDANGVRFPEGVIAASYLSAPRRVMVPEFEIAPITQINDIRIRRFSLIDRYNSLVVESVRITPRRSRFARILSSLEEAA